MGALKESNFAKYCGGSSFSIIDENEIAGVLGLLQKNYGEEQDCTLTSMTALIQFYTKEKVEDIYTEVEKVAKKLGYKGNVGTNPIVIRTLMWTLFNKFKIKKLCCSCYLKSVGFTIKFIKQLIKKDIPIILNLSTDGRNYYKNHSVLIVGYREIKSPNNKTMFFLKIKDNWTKETVYIDYSKLNMICSINYAT